MRCYQEMGLRSEACIWLWDNCEKEPTEFCKHCGKPNGETLKFLNTEHHDSFMGDGPCLHTYLTKDGKKVEEIIQAEPWSSGPVCFLCLQLEDGTRLFEWSEKDINDA